MAADHNKFGEAVGMQVGADQQCKVLMKDKNARVDEEASGGKDKICNGMICKSSRRSEHGSTLHRCYEDI